MGDKLLRAAQRAAARALRDWHRSGDQDLSEFEGFSLADISRMELGIPLARLFRAAALGRDPGSPDFLKDGQDEKYGPMPEFSLDWRRGDWRARAYRLAHRLVRSLGADAPKKTVLFIGASSNRGLWDHWFSRRDELPFRFDFALSYPPGLSNGLRAAAAGARLFDPEPHELTPEQRSRIAGMRSDLGRLDRRELFSFDGKDLAEAFRRQALACFLPKLEDLAAKCLAFEREFAAKKPDLLLLPHESGPDARLLRRLARRHGVPAWLMEHGYAGSGYTLDDNLICGDLDAERILAWSEADKRSYLAAGVPARRVDAVGPPAFDAFLPFPTARPLRSVKGATILVLSYVRFFGTTEYYDDNEERFFEDTARLLDRLGAAKIIFKLHAGIARLDFYQKLAARLGLSCRIEYHQHARFLDLLEQADAVVGAVTTGVFEATLRGKDYFLLHCDPSEIPPPLETKNAFVAKSAAELERNLLEARPVPREALEEFCGLKGGELPGYFSNRVLDQLATALKDT